MLEVISKSIKKEVCQSIVREYTVSSALHNSAIDILRRLSITRTSSYKNIRFLIALFRYARIIHWPDFRNNKNERSNNVSLSGALNPGGLYHKNLSSAVLSCNFQ